MYVATMEYPLLTTVAPSEAAAVWKALVLDAARTQEGFVRMQLYSQMGALLAIGTWQEKRHAEAFMRTGVFLRLKETLAPMLAGEPHPRLWEQEAFLTS